MITTGYLSAARIEANSITVNKLASDVGQNLDISSNTSISLSVGTPLGDQLNTVLSQYDFEQVTVSDTEPEDPQDGDLWLDTGDKVDDETGEVSHYDELKRYTAGYTDEQEVAVEGGTEQPEEATTAAWVEIAVNEDYSTFVPYTQVTLTVNGTDRTITIPEELRPFYSGTIHIDDDNTITFTNACEVIESYDPDEDGALPDTAYVSDGTVSEPVTGCVVLIPYDEEEEITSNIVAVEGAPVQLAASANTLSSDVGTVTWAFLRTEEVVHEGGWNRVLVTDDDLAKLRTEYSAEIQIAKNAILSQVESVNQYGVATRTQLGVVESGLQASINKTQNDLDGYKETVNTYLDFSEDGLTLGKKKSLNDAQEHFKVTLTPDLLAFRDGDTNNTVAYIGRDALYITKAEIADRLMFGTSDLAGYFDWITTSKGTGIKWRGRTSTGIGS